MNRISSFRAAVCGGVVCALVSLAAAGPPVVVADAGRVVKLDVEAVREAPSGASFAVEGVEVAGWGRVDLELERFRVAGGRTRFVAGSAEGDREIAFDPESVVFLRGRAIGLAGSHVVMAMTPRGVTGRIELGPGRPTVGLASAPGGDGPGVERVAMRPWVAGPAPVLACGFEAATAGLAGGPGLDAAGAGGARGDAGGAAPVDPIRGLKQVEMAVDSDLAYFQLMGSEAAALEYIVTTYGFVSDVMVRDLNARVDLVWVRIWVGPEPDPYGGMGGFPRIPAGVSFDQSQLFAAERVSWAGGAAWRCSNTSWIGHVLGFYGDAIGPHVDNRDIIVSAHELGHALGTGHTHDYALDQCHVATSKPNRSSIMSYCYYFSGGYANTDLRFQTVPGEWIGRCVSYRRLAFDCNQNGIDDAEDIGSGFSADENGNGIPDECEDCNGNGVLDDEDIGSGFSLDLNGNGVPDECEPDCNGNGVPDGMDIAGYEQVVLSDDFETDRGWIAEKLVAVSGDWERAVPVADPSWPWAPLVDSDGSGKCWLTDNRPGASGVSRGTVRLTSSVFDLAFGGAILRYDYYLGLQRVGVEDRMLVEVSDDAGETWFELLVHDRSADWTTVSFTEGDIRASGAEVTDRMRLRFTVNDFHPYTAVEAAIDAFRLVKVHAPLPDENGNGIPDECEADLDGDGRSDYLQIQADMSLDVNRNAMLDAFEDCDSDGIPDLVALDGAWSGWVADGLDGALREYHPVTGVLMRESETGLVEAPRDVLITPDRRILVSDAAADRIVEFNARAEIVGDLVAPGAGGLSDPGAMLVRGGELLVASAGTDSVLRFDLETGAPFGALVEPGSGGLTRPYGMTFGPRGSLYVTSADNQVMQYTPTGAFQRIFVTEADNGGLDSPRDILFTTAIEPPAPTPPAQARFLVASEFTSEILEFDPDTGAFRQVFNIGTQDGKLERPWGMVIGRDGEIYLSSRPNLESAGAPGGGRGPTAASHLTDPKIFQYQMRTGLLLRPYVQRPDSKLPDPVGFAFMPGDDIDCNFNQLPDACDIASGFSADANGNGVPDECETCYADCDGSGWLDFFDFLCFQSAFAAGEPGADCDGSGVLDFFDFLCFQNGYAAGCG